MWRYYYLIRAQFPLHVLYPSETDCEIDLRLMFDWKGEVPAESNQRGRKTVCRDTTGREKERERELLRSQRHGRRAETDMDRKLEVTPF